MDYTVGSIADLITGKITVDKPTTKPNNDSVEKKEKTLTNTSAISRITKKIKKSKKSFKPRPLKEEPQHRSRDDHACTVFVGNVPIGISKKKIKTFFKKYGPVKSIRFRGIIINNRHYPKETSKAPVKDLLPERKSCYCFVSFTNEEDALKAEEGNGSLFEGHHLNIHLCSKSDKHPEEDKTIFVGNLSFAAEDDDLWEVFEQCGDISRVRIVRDKVTGLGKGFAYVNFEDADAVQLALEMENVKIKNREIRIKISNPKASEKLKKNKEQGLKVKKLKPNIKNKKKLKINKSLIKNVKNIAPRTK